MNKKQKADFVRVIGITLFGVLAILLIPYLFHYFM